ALARQQQQLMQADLKRGVDFTDAYIDRLVLNVYGGPGQTEVWIDDLEAGPLAEATPFRPVSRTTPLAGPLPGTPAQARAAVAGGHRPGGDALPPGGRGAVLGPGRRAGAGAGRARGPGGPGAAAGRPAAAAGRGRLGRAAHLLARPRPGRGAPLAADDLPGAA